MDFEALTCVWVLACTIVRTIMQQLDAAFRSFDPLDNMTKIRAIGQLSSVLEQANKLARIDRYASALAEVLGFFDAIRSFQQTLKPADQASTQGIQRCYSRISDRSNLESKLAKQKITYAQQLCRTYIRQYESHVQMMLSHHTSQISDRLDSGRKIGERIAAVGLVLAAISGLTSPLAIVTGYFGMNVAEFVDGGQSSLFQFWQVALPIIALSVVVLSVLSLRFMVRDKGKGEMRPHFITSWADG